ncbi:MAG: nucleotidyltransferase domain-containing protein [Deltaproteobacteria bacterium]|nr:nucleotidyltransferase domain-containing protein [Deltaproteobacteria bacterium]
MVEIPTEIRKTVAKYIRALKENHVNVEQAVLFGSYAKGNFSEWSDIDLAVVSKAFEGSWIKDRKKIRAITLSISSDIQVLPYRPEDFVVDDPFVREIIETGIRLH